MDFISEKERFVPPDDLGTKVPQQEAERFVSDCLVKVQASRHHADALARVLVAADVRGHYSHGLQRLELYVNEVRTKLCDANATPSILQENAATALVDGNNGLGPVVAEFCMDLAMKKAKDCGVGWVVCHGSNHYGIAGWYSLVAAERGLVGLSFTNTSPVVTANRGKGPFLGTNPISVAAPNHHGDHFVLDMATSVVSSGKVEMAMLKGEKIPEAWAVDKEGRLSTEPDDLLRGGGALLPLGGTEMHSAYKGFGLAMMVEIFTGILSGGNYGPNIEDWAHRKNPANLSHCLVALDPACFAPGFKDRLADLMNTARNLEPTEAGKPVLVAGDPEAGHTAGVARAGGITYHINQIKKSWQLAKYLDVEPMKSMK